MLVSGMSGFGLLKGGGGYSINFDGVAALASVYKMVFGAHLLTIFSI